MIEFQTVSIADRSKEVFEREKIRFENELGMSIMLSHCGYFSQDLVNGFTEGVEEMLISANEKKSLIKRVFSIMIEGLQNIRFHGEADDFGKYYGLFFIAKNEEKIVIYFGSLVRDGVHLALNERLQKLNDLSDGDVKEHYLSILSDGKISTEGNAGLGFITMRMKSKSQLKYRFYSLSDCKQLFTFETTLHKIK